MIDAYKKVKHSQKMTSGQLRQRYTRNPTEKDN